MVDLLTENIQTFSENIFPASLDCTPKFRMIEAVGYIERVVLKSS